MKTVIRTGNVEGFFNRGRNVARLADQGKAIPAERIIAYEDPEDLARILTTAKIIDDLEQAGLVSVEEKPYPGHGRLKEVRATAGRVVLEAVFA
ncbi:MAG: hypothetical protein Q8M20_05930 [Rhodocyclaceae bacterium]|nr:hypothetical protein [Rhodocyclaceae bacterium]MDZ4214566.1 hypothetical protein [Rhodocyclaceae bacterium]